jgi:hypothetical protein
MTRLVLLAAAALLTDLCASPVFADGDVVPIGNHVANVTIPMDTMVADPNTLETVHLTGSLLVKTQIKYAPGNLCKVQTQFKLGKDVAAVGMTSGDPYKVKGKGTVKYNWFPQNPVKGVDHTGLLVVIPPAPIIPGNPVFPPNPIRVHYHVDYDTAGNVSGSLVYLPISPIVAACHPIAQVCN